MARIPTYQREQSMAAPMNVARATTAISPNSPVAQAMGSLANVAGNVGNTLAQIDEIKQRKEIEKQENVAAVQVSNVLSEADVYWQQNTTERFKAYTVDQGDMRESIGKDFDKWQAETVEKLPTEKSKQYFLQHAAKMKSNLQTGAYAFQEKAVTNKLNADSAAGEQADENAVFNDATKFDETYRRRVEPLIARTDIDEATKIKMADQYKRKLSLAVERGEMERDPAGWYKRRFGTFDPGVGGKGGATSAGFEGVMTQIFKTEGGYSASDGNTGNPVNFGINQGANPDVDVKNLTKEEAAKIYKTRYWDKIGGDNLPPALQGTAMDAAVNQGPANAKKWIAESGGDVKKFNELRRAHYENLLQDPANRKFRSAWMGRLSKYEDGTAASGPVSETGEPIQQPKTFAGMDWEQQLALKQHAETRLKQAEATFKADADRTVRDAIAMHNDGQVDNFNLSRDYFDRAYGADGERIYGEYQKSRDMGADIGRFKTQSESEIRAELEADKPVPGRGYAAEDERYGTRVRAAQNVLDQRKKDPAGYATANNPDLKAQAVTLEGMPSGDAMRPALMQKYVRDSLAEQTRLGIANPQVLTPGQADAIGQAAQKLAKPDDAARLVAGLEQEYGEHFPRVFDQLVKDEKISGELLIIPNIPSQAARESVSRLSRIKESDLQAGIDAKDIKDVKDKTTQVLEGFVKAVPFGTTQAARVTNAYEAIIRKRAFELTQGGMAPGDAVNQAYGQVLGHYEFDGGTRYPKGIDVGAVQKGADYVLQTKIADIDPPADLTGARNPEELQAEWMRTVQARPLWHTRDDDTGLELYAMGANGTKYRVTRGGQPVSYSWADLKQTAETPASSPSDALVRKDMRAYERQRAEENRLRVKRENDAAAAMRIK